MSGDSQQHELLPVAAAVVYQDLVDPCLPDLVDASMQERLSLVQAMACGYTAHATCYTTGYVCPLCVLKGLVRLYLYGEEGLSIVGIRALAAWGMAEIQHDWARQQSRLMVVASSPLYLGGRSNSLLRGPDYIRYYGLRHP